MGKQLSNNEKFQFQWTETSDKESVWRDGYRFHEKKQQECPLFSSSPLVVKKTPLFKERE
jgi:hypothetical protein